MTFQPPPQQPPGGPPPPPPPGNWGPPPGGGGYSQGGGGGGGQFDPKAVNPLDWGILAAGLLAFIFSFFDWYTASVSVGGFSSSAGESAWNGFFGWFAVLLAVVGAALVAVSLFAPQVSLPFPVRLTSVILFAVATLSVILALFIFPEDVPDNSNIDTGRGFGFWAGAIVILAGLVLSVMRLQQTGGQLPGALGKVPNIGRHGPQGGIAGASGGPATQGYPPQQSYGQPPAQAPQQGQYQPPQPGYGPPPQAPQPPQAPPPPPQQYQPPPQQGGQYQPPPQQGGQYQPPPQQGGPYQPPQQPPQGGQYRPPQP
jgi:hypothetical protein